MNEKLSHDTLQARYHIDCALELLPESLVAERATTEALRAALDAQINRDRRILTQQLNFHTLADICRPEAL